MLINQFFKIIFLCSSNNSSKCLLLFSDISNCRLIAWIDSSFRTIADFTLSWTAFSSDSFSDLEFSISSLCLRKKGFREKIYMYA